MLRSEFIEKIERFRDEILQDSEIIEDENNFQNLCEISSFCFEVKNRVENLKDSLK